ncbi:hypothetical protein NMG60_11025315 [Bertholletia excelsa]
MSNILWKNFHLCFSKFKCLSLPPPPPQPSPLDHSRPSSIPDATPALINTFNSLYDLPSFTSSSDNFFSSDSDSDIAATASPPPQDLAAAFASHRFFFSSPGQSNSILDTPETSLSPVADGVAVPKYSADPFRDFRQSMQEMVDAREVVDVEEDWNYLHELLLCYLSMNPKHTHKFIVGAFADLLVSLVPEKSPDVRRKPRSCPTSEVSRQLS